MRLWLLVLTSLLVSACSTAPVATVNPVSLFHDDLFLPATVQIRPEAALEMSDSMREFARTRLQQHGLQRVDKPDRRMTLVDALYTKGQLRLQYYSDVTYTAQEAFAAKSGNCLSLVLLTAAMARELQLPYHFQLAIGAADWGESGDLFMTIDHVNLVLEEIPSEFDLHTYTANPIIVDFLVPDIAARLESRPIEENTILAMYLNNRSIETMVQGDNNNAYWWIKAALQSDPEFWNAYLSLAVIYRNMHKPELANSVLEYVAIFEPNNTTMLSDRALVLRDLGRNAEADQLLKKLAVIDQNRPWNFYFEAQSEYRAGHYEKAKDLFVQQIAHDPDHHEFEFGLALAYAKLNDVTNATVHLERAVNLCNSGRTRRKYELKLQQLKSTGSL